MILYGELLNAQTAKWIKIPAQQLHNGYTDIRMDNDTWCKPIPIGSDFARDDTLPLNLRQILIQTKRLIDREKDAFKPCCPIKHASTDFIWFGRYYRLDTSTFALTNEQFDHFTDRIEKILISYGCPFTRYTGMID